MKRQDSADDFEAWLSIMDDALERLNGALPDAIVAHLDRSPSSLRELEGWMLSRFATHEELLLPKHTELLDGLARYVGEVFRSALEGVRWTIRFEDPSFAFHGLPILVERDSGHTVGCPHTLVTTSLARRRGDFLEKLLRRKLST